MWSSKHSTPDPWPLLCTSFKGYAAKTLHDRNEWSSLNSSGSINLPWCGCLLRFTSEPCGKCRWRGKPFVNQKDTRGRMALALITLTAGAIKRIRIPVSFSAVINPDANQKPLQQAGAARFSPHYRGRERDLLYYSLIKFTLAGNSSCGCVFLSQTTQLRS